MKDISKILALIFCLLTPLVFVGCKDDKDEPKKDTTLVVSPATLSMLSNKGATVTFSIKCNGIWTIANIPEWINLSATSGNGDATIIATALSDNNDDENRSATIDITTENNSEQVVINQLPAFVSDCSVEFSDILTMTTSIAFKYDIKPGVSYFYSGYLDKSAAGWTDDKIVEVLTDDDRFDPKSSDATGLQGFGSMDPDTEYYLCSVAFNEKGERGKLVKTKIRTLKTNDQSPFITINDVEYTTDKWFWDTSINAYTTKYYMVNVDGDYAEAYHYYFTEAEIAWIMKSMVDSGDLTAIANSASWQTPRTPGANQLLIATWGVDISGNFAPRVNIYYGTLSSGSRLKSKYSLSTSSAKKRTCIPSDKLETLMQSAKGYTRR